MISPVRSPHICFVSAELYPVIAPDLTAQVIGGAELQQAYLAKNLVASGYPVSVVTQDYGQENGVELSGIKVYKTCRPDTGIPIMRFFYPRLSSLWRALRQANADIYYQRCAGAITGIVGLFARMQGARFVYAAASDTDFVPGRQLLKSRRERVFFEYGLKCADIVVAQNEEQVRLCHANYGIRAQLIPSIYELSFESASHEPEPKDIDVLWVSTIRRCKRPDRALLIAKMCPQVRFVMVGGANVDEKEYFEEIRHQAKCVQNVNFVGFSPFSETEKLFSRAKLFLNTSASEGFPNTYLQSWARAIPTIALRDSGPNQNDIGIGLTVSSEEKAAQTIQHLLDKDQERSQIGARCRKYYENNHPVEKVMKYYEGLFSKLMSRNRK